MNSPFPAPPTNPVQDAPVILAAVKIIKRLIALCPAFAHAPDENGNIRYSIAEAGSIDDAANTGLPLPSAHIIHRGGSAVHTDIFAIGQGNYELPTMENWEIIILSSELTDNRRGRSAEAQRESILLMNQVIAAITNWTPDYDAPIPTEQTRRVAQVIKWEPVLVDGEKMHSSVIIGFPNIIVGAQGYPPQSVDLSSIHLMTAEGGNDHSHGSVVNTSDDPPT